ncbi:MAG: hypothetical protein WBP56_17820 [Polyangia bacterium]|jgi:hypothetical protein
MTDAGSYIVQADLVEQVGTDIGQGTHVIGCAAYHDATGLSREANASALRCTQELENSVRYIFPYQAALLLNTQTPTERVT